MFIIGGKIGRLILYSFFVFLLGLLVYSIFFIFWLSSKLFSPGINIAPPLDLANWLFLIAGIGAFADLAYVTIKSEKRDLIYKPVKKMKISVGMTAYNDELSIGAAVREFLAMDGVAEVIVIDNNCTDRTAEVARKAGAKVVPEKVQGYGAACIRALKECRKSGNLICLVEGDQTFFAPDLKKLMAYIENVDMVVGTRTTMEIVSSDSQLTHFMRIGNLFIAKLVQMRHWGKVRLTDVGCTYRLIRPEALDRIIGGLYITGNHFSPHMILVGLKNGLRIIECPISFKKRVGGSKGVGSDIIKGLVNGMKMIAVLLQS